VNFVAAYCKFIAVDFALGVFQDVEDFIVLVIGEVAISKETPRLLCIFFCKQSFGKEGGVRRNVVMERFSDGFDELSLQSGIVL
jgi:hypothetical protein